MDRIIGKPDFSKTVATAIRTAKWATVMTKWRIAFETGGKQLGSANVKPTRRWQLVGFPGPASLEGPEVMGSRLALQQCVIARPVPAYLWPNG